MHIPLFRRYDMLPRILNWPSVIPLVSVNNISTLVSDWSRLTILYSKVIIASLGKTITLSQADYFRYSGSKDFQGTTHLNCLRMSRIHRLARVERRYIYAVGF